MKTRGADRATGRLARLGRAREFDIAAFEEALAEAAPDSSAGSVLRELFLEWAGLSVDEREAAELWEGVRKAHGLLEAALGRPVSLQAALVDDLHTRLGMLREPRILAGRELSALRVNAITDPLTGLYNRRFLHEHLGREIARAERTTGLLSIVLMDLHRFKVINDQLGHPVGDAVLVKTARVIRDSLRAIDAGCRFGGDEFVAVLPNTTLVGSLAVAERIRLGVSRIALPRRLGIRMGLHYGVATFPSDGRTVDFLVKTADQRLYDCRRHDSDPRTRRHPRFAVSGVGLRLSPALAKYKDCVVKDIGYGGLSFISPSERMPAHLEGDLVQHSGVATHRVAMRPVSVLPYGDGRARVGCAYVH